MQSIEAGIPKQSLGTRKFGNDPKIRYNQNLLITRKTKLAFGWLLSIVLIPITWAELNFWRRHYI